MIENNEALLYETFSFYGLSAVSFIFLTSAIASGGSVVGVGLLTAFKYGLVSSIPVASTGATVAATATGSAAISCLASIGIASCLHAADTDASMLSVAKLSLLANLCGAPVFAVVGAKILALPMGYAATAAFVGTPLLVIVLTAIGSKILRVSFVDVATAFMKDVKEIVVPPIRFLGIGLKGCLSQVVPRDCCASESEHKSDREARKASVRPEPPVFSSPPFRHANARLTISPPCASEAAPCSHPGTVGQVV